MKRTAQAALALSVKGNQMATIITINCDECGGRSVVKIPTDYQDDFEVQCCPLCGSPYEGHDDMGEDD
jgi:transcription elongation factor Elf1